MDPFLGHEVSVDAVAEIRNRDVEPGRFEFVVRAPDRGGDPLRFVREDAPADGSQYHLGDLTFFFSVTESQWVALVSSVAYIAVERFVSKVEVPSSCHAALLSSGT